MQNRYITGDAVTEHRGEMVVSSGGQGARDRRAGLRVGAVVSPAGLEIACHGATFTICI